MHIRGSEKTSEVHVYNGEAAARLDFFFVRFFPVEQTTSGMGHRQSRFFELSTSTLNVRNNLFLQPMIPPIRFDTFPPLSRGCSEGLDAFRFFFKQQQ